MIFETVLSVVLAMAAGSGGQENKNESTIGLRDETMKNLKYLGSKAVPENAFSAYKKVISHTHFDRSGKEFFQNGDRLADYCRSFKIDTVGVGSPWTPKATMAYHVNERENRAKYDANGPTEADYQREEVNGLFDELNRRGKTFYYIDNETPKGRNGHCWYFNFKYLYPAWHDYSQDRPVQYYWNDPHIEINPLTKEPFRRRAYYRVLSEQKASGAVCVWAHPTSWWHNPDGSFVTNLAAELPSHLLLDGTLGGLTVSGYDAFHRDYRALYFLLLDRGYRFPAFGETDLTPAWTVKHKNEPLILSRIRLPEKYTASDIAHAAASGDVYIGKGIDITLEVDGRPMGSTLTAKAGAKHVLRVTLGCAPGEQRCSRMEINSRGGKAVAVLENCAPGIYEFEYEDDGSYTYFTACAFGENDDCRKRQQAIKFFSMTNPVWLAPEGCEAPKPAEMNCTIRFKPDSFFLGWTLQIGDEKTAVTVKPGEIRRKMPARTEIVLTSPKGRVVRLYPYFEDANVQKLISYISAGEFLRDYPEKEPGEVPTQAFDPEQWRALLPHIVAEL